MKQTKLILTRTALLLFVMLLTQTAWAYKLSNAKVILKYDGTSVEYEAGHDGTVTGDKMLHMTYTGQKLTPTVEVWVNNEQAELDVDFTVKFNDNVYATGSTAANGKKASVTISKKGNSFFNGNGGNGDITRYFYIDQAPAVTVSAKLKYPATERVYNGSVLSTDEVELSYTNLIANHTVSGVTLGGFSPADSGDAGNYSILVSEESEGSAKIMLGETDVTDCFEGLTISNGSLTVKQRPITITAANAGIFYGETYGGTIATPDEKVVTVTPGLAEGDVLTSITLKVYNTADTPEEVENVSAADVGSYTITPSLAVIKDGETDVTANYYITWENGDLVIQQDGVIVTITGKNNTVDYNGKEQPVSGYDYVISYPENSSEETHTYSADLFKYEKDEATEPVAKGTDAGTYNMEILANDFDNIDENYTVTFVVAADGYLTISPIDATVTIVGNNDTKDYDGTEHSVSGYTATASPTLYKVTKENEDDVLDFTFGETSTAEAARTDAGTTYMGLTKDDFTNVSKNFANVTFIVTDGYMTITAPEVTVTITGHQGGYEYNNEEHAISGYDVEISSELYTEADFTFSGTAEVKATAAGVYFMGLKDSQFKNTNSNFTVTFDVTDGYMTIDYHIAALADNADNTATITSIVEHNFCTADVTLAGRTLYKDGAWNTICLPFDVTIAGSPLAGADVRELSSASFADGTLNLEFTAVTAIKAGVPYIIKWANGSNISNPAFNAMVFSTELKDKTCDLGDGKSITFKGTYAPVAYDATDKSVLLVGEGSTLYYPEAGAFTNAQRAYFQLEGLEVGTVESNAIGLRFGDATGINNVLTPASDATYYDLSGRRVAEPTKGIYIVNGKKVVIK